MKRVMIYCLWILMLSTQTVDSQVDIFSPEVQALAIHMDTSSPMEVKEVKNQALQGQTDTISIDSQLVVDSIKTDTVVGINIADYYPVPDFYQNWSTEQLKPYVDFVPGKFYGVDTLYLVGFGDSRFTPPVDNVITSHFGPRWGRAHNGTDLDLEKGDPVGCAFDGVVRVAKYVSGYGNLVIVRHLNGLESWYAHLTKIYVSSGETIFSGDPVGGGGSTGRATGTHLHFELRYKDHPFDTRKIIDWSTGTLLQTMMVIDRTFFGLSYPTHSPDHHDHSHDLLTQFHTIQKRDTLYGLARKYGTTVNAICELNKIKRTSVLRIGQRLLIQ